MTDKDALCILGRLNKLSEVAARKCSKDEEILNLCQALQVGIDAIKQKRPHGYWDKVNHGDYENLDIAIRCSECLEEVDEESNYCPYCGADMREAENEITD